MTIVGIDPGLSGAVAWICDGDLLWVEDMPVMDGRVDAVNLADMVQAHSPGGRPEMVVVEKVASMPKQGVASTFTFGQSYGTALGVVGALELPLRLVRPTEWKRAMRLGGGKESKEKARAAAIDRWPRRAEWFARKRDHGRADAALLAQWHLEHGTTT